jgi:hypothetical protein
MNPVLDPLFVWIAIAGMAVLLGHAAIVKVQDLGLWSQHLAAYGVPGRVRKLVFWMLPGAEALAAALLLTPWRWIGASLAAGLLLLYGAVMAWQRIQGRTPDCGCGGEAIPVSWALVARNLVLVCMALAAGLPMVERSLDGGDYLVVAAAVVLATLNYAAFHQVLRHRTTPRSTSARWRTR